MLIIHPAIDVRAYKEKISHVAAEHTRERRQIAEFAIRSLHPLIGERRIAENLVQASEYPKDVRDSLELIAPELGRLGIARPTAERALGCREQNPLLSAL